MRVRVWATSDLHGAFDQCFDALERLLQKEGHPPDFLFFLGDLIPNSRWEQQLRSFYGRVAQELPCPIFSVLGNHEEMQGQRQRPLVAIRNAIYRCGGTRVRTLSNHSVAVEVRGYPIRIAGLGWDPLFKMTSLPDETVAQKVAEIAAGLAADEPPHFLLSHSPAQGILDRSMAGNAIGSPIVRGLLELIEPKTGFFCGHVHEGAGAFEDNGILHVNACAFAERTLSPNTQVVIHSHLFDVRCEG